jgi:hypothetical protein
MPYLTSGEIIDPHRVNWAMVNNIHGLENMATNSTKTP